MSDPCKTDAAERTVSVLGDGPNLQSRSVVRVGYCLTILWTVQLNPRSGQGQYSPLYRRSARDGKCVARNTARIAITQVIVK
jgi:hypothetical protein